MKEEKIFIPSDTVQLEGLLNIQGAFPVKGAVVLCHPHPQYGGDMHNPVILTSTEVAFQEGFSTLRFNFRGVGESGGSHSNGIGERKDVEAAINYLFLQQKTSSLPLAVLGYSFGAIVGLSVGVQDRRVQAMVAIAPPLELHDFGFLMGSKKQKLVIVGSRDPFCPSRLLEKWYQELEEPKSLALIQGADHFFFSHTQFLVEHLQGFFKVISQPQIQS